MVRAVADVGIAGGDLPAFEDIQGVVRAEIADKSVTFRPLRTSALHGDRIPVAPCSAGFLAPPDGRNGALARGGLELGAVAK